VSAEQFDPSLLTNFCYELAKAYHKFYNDVRILGAESEGAKAFRVNLGNQVARVLKHGFGLIGIEMPNRM
jgi:arginyl-tRNA synthetase